MRRGIFYLIATLIGFSQPVLAATSTNSTKATAQLVASCTINASNVSFGTLLLPLSNQPATSSMTVLCSNGASYTIGMAYGGVYGTGTGVTGNLPLQSAVQYPSWASCNYSGSINGQNYTSTQNYTLSYYWNYGCPANYTYSSPAYNYGLMTGTVKGDKIAYSIQVPGNPSQVWNSGNFSYTATGTGSSQSIPVKATLVPGQSSSSYPAPDMYMDTATATINF